jgi:hypothetical protein
MPAKLTADLILLLHLAFVLFVIFGGLLLWYRRAFAWLHLPMALWGAAVNIASWPCPLTPLEKHYRQLAGQSGYEGGFVEHYIAPLIYPEALTSDLGLTVGVTVIVWNGAIYATWWRRARRAGGKKRCP